MVVHVVELYFLLKQLVLNISGHIVSDGGCNLPGDIAKAFEAGAHFLMLGGMLSGHDESGGENIEKEGKKFKLFYGMSSEYAKKKYNGGMENYRSSEGKLKCIPDKGPVNATIQDILGGLRSTGTYQLNYPGRTIFQIYQLDNRIIHAFAKKIFFLVLTNVE